MISRSVHEILWVQPDLEEERWEFSHHPHKQEYYQRHGITWSKIASCFHGGELAPYPRTGMIGSITVSLSYHTYEEYSRYLAKAKRGYRLNYSRMEDELQRSGRLTMKAPIVLAHGDNGMLFSGYRRLCLAWNYGMVPNVWLVTLDQGSDRTSRQ